MTQLSQQQQGLAKHLWNLGAVKTSGHPDAIVRESGERGFLLKAHEKNPDWPLSPFYLNLRTRDNPKPGPLDEESIAMAASLMFERLRESGTRAEFIAGIPNAGDPFADELGRISWIPVLRFKKEDLGDGKRRIGRVINDGDVAGKQALLVDDLITMADSKIEAIQSLQDVGMVVVALSVLVDRQQGGVPALQAAGVPVFSVFTVSELLDYYRDEGWLAGNLHADIMKYLGLQGT